MWYPRPLTTVVHTDGVVDLAIVILIAVVGDACGCLVALSASLLRHKPNLDLGWRRNKMASRSVINPVDVKIAR
jgi:hypothetical protein